MHSCALPLDMAKVQVDKVLDDYVDPFVSIPPEEDATKLG